MERVAETATQIMESAAPAVDHLHSKSFHGFLAPTDYVGISFWIISIAMVASTVFFLMESTRVSHHWKTSLTIGSLVTLVAGVHYFYMREFWITIGESPIVYRYIDWTITVPLQMVEFYFIMKAAGQRPTGGAFWRLLLGTLIMLLSGYAGEEGVVSAWPGFIVGMMGWFFILNEIFNGEIGSLNTEKCSIHVQTAFNNMRFIVTVGWAIYPAGYFFGLLMPVANANALNIIYNIADVVNKIAFVACIWTCAVADTENDQETAAGGLLQSA
jgi:bacteriorhodopsin